MLKPGDKVPTLELPLTIDAKFVLADQDPDSFTMLVFYRGKHCPVCKRYLTELAGKLDDFTKAGVNTFTVSMDDEDRAMTIDREWDTGDVPLAYDLSEEKAREWGLFISEGRPDSEEPAKFSEPGLFLVKPDGTLYFSVVQSGPFTRPPLDELVEAIQFVTEKDYPARGTLT
ncbi:redoxin domain-containing protein [Altererythrobacter aurantiacus]|uniref:Redoxin domain-containing protein n=1 Tax=Parapontixanthobacter aurantiacus TaxID=1463599 RepID=A0A844ZDT1_9SPHN|nr:peroxiredoxin-like family protein [Parapontixanthobacter aurantiacus]MXO85316.1 redoxin domain-containing protein [Parapontixanthobacter aurantiacus]